MPVVQELTNYQFDSEPKALHGALDRFAQFFLAPLCKADALEREVSAVDNEFAGELGMADATLCYCYPYFWRRHARQMP